MLVIEDDRYVGPVLLRRVRRKFEATLVTTCHAARERLASGRWAGCIVDVSLPDGCGIGLVRDLRRAGSVTPALVITGRQEPFLANQAQVLGVEFAYKPDIAVSVDAFLDRVGQLRDGDRTLRSTDDFTRAARLSPGEAAVVRLFVEGVARKDLATRLEVSENTLKTTIRKLLQKCARHTLEEVRTAILKESTQPSAAVAS